MLQVVTNPSEIKSCVRLFHKRLKMVTLKKLWITLVEYEMRNGDVIFRGLNPHTFYAQP